MQNTIIKQFENDPDVVTAVFDQGGKNGETLAWVKVFWANYFLRNFVIWDPTGAVGQLYGMPQTGLPFGRGFVIDQTGKVALPFFGHRPELVIETIYGLLGCSEPETYCTAKVNSCGTVPSIGAKGRSSATNTSGFVVSAANTKAGKFGLLLYTDSGRGNAPFGGGLLCLDTSALRRSVAVVDTTGTSGQCDGTLSIDMNAFAHGLLGGHPLASLLVPGTRFDAQFWGRDAVGNALLSDALEFVVCE